MDWSVHSVTRCVSRLLAVNKTLSWLTICLLAIRITFAANLDTHTVVLDGTGKIIPWTANPGSGYDRVMFLSWDLLINHIPNDPANGLPVTYTHSEYQPTSLSGSSWPNNPAGKNAMLADSAIMYYAYSGNRAVIDLVEGLLDHQLQRGTTPANYTWAKVPWSTAAAGSINYGNDNAGEGVGVLEPDKVGELGYHGYLKFYQLTGNTNYRNAAIACADELAQHIRTGDSSRSPWPFRVNAQTGATAQQQEYCSHVIAPIRLFDELIRLGLGNTNAYLSARQTAWTWLMTYPMVNDTWVSYFEDVPPVTDFSNGNQYNAGQTARYLMERPELDPNWLAHVTDLLQYVENNFGGTDNGESGLQYGARVISEQMRYKYKMASHTGRFGANNALLYSLTGNLTTKDKAYRSLNWCTYMCRNNGVVIEGPVEFANNAPCWFTDGHGDYIRHFMIAIGAVPEWAPAGENHIVRSTSVIQSVNYPTNNEGITYTTFDSASTETLRLAFIPGEVLVDGSPLFPVQDLSSEGWVFTSSNSVLRIRHDNGRNVQIVELPIAIALSNGVPYATSNSGGENPEDFFHFSVPGSAARLQFEILQPSGEMALAVRKGLPLPNLGSFDYLSDSPGTSEEHILLFTNSSPVQVSAGDWYLTAVNKAGQNIDYTIKATQWPVSGQPIILGIPEIQTDNFCFSWNSLPGARYVVQGTVSLNSPAWLNTSETITATSVSTTHCQPLPSPYQFFRIVETVAPDEGARPAILKGKSAADSPVPDWLENLESQQARL